MVFFKANGTLYPATISGRVSDDDWDGRESKAVTLTMTYGEAVALFCDGLAWSIVDRTETEDGLQESEWDNSDYCIAGDVIDHRDGTVTAKMGRLTDLEAALESMLGGGKR